MTIKEIEENLKTGQVAPQILAEYSDFLSSTSSQLMDRQLELQNMYADYFSRVRGDVASDKAVLMKWRLEIQGKAELQIETTQKKIKVLLQTIGRHLRVASDSARNMY